ncbi:MAG TPA: hypothetical protein VFQ53_17970 [Kofleriaceae bacterium]|nr:hypothetical protein [Kofleriaceae bacterium]
MRALVTILFAALVVSTAAADPDKPADPKPDDTADKQPDKQPDTKPDKTSDSSPDTKSDSSPDTKSDTKADKKADADKPAPEPRKPGPQDAKVVAILDKIVAGPDTAARKAAIAELDKLAPEAIDQIGEWLVRPHTVDIAERRKVLDAIKAAIPDKSGKFSPPPRQTEKERQAQDKLDWLAALLELDPAMPGVGEVIGDVAAIRALVATKDLHAAQLVFDAAFVADTMIYRDECGRYLRKMEPYSIPALTAESQRRNYDRRRYATFQLERLDRQDPQKAIDAGLGNEAVQVALLDVFRKTKHREAVHAVWMHVDDDNPAIRAAARAAFMDYITGPPPPPAPKKKLQLPGGKLTKKPKPLWLTYRELADNEIRKSANELLGEDYPIAEQSLDDRDEEIRIKPIDQVEVTKRLFAYFDEQRAKQDAAQWQAAKQKADAGDLATATAMLDRLIVTNPNRTERGEMAKVYFAFGKQLESAQKWSEASSAFSKAHGLDPQGANAKQALAAHHYTLGKALESQGKDGGPDFRRAIALDPEYAPAKKAADTIASAQGRPVWMLYAAIAAGLTAMLLFAAAMMKRRAS